MKKADRSGASVALLWGEDEVAAGEVTVKPLRGAAEQQRMARIAGEFCAP
jgi:histidyl-tRNA synthetase